MEEGEIYSATLLAENAPRFDPAASGLWEAIIVTVSILQARDGTCVALRSAVLLWLARRRKDEEGKNDKS
jgi:hypothetical protein